MTSDIRALIDQVNGEEAELVFDAFDSDTAYALGTFMVQEARDQELPLVIEIRRGTHLLFHVSLPGATGNNDAWIARKGRTVDLYQTSSLLQGLRPQLDGTDFFAKTGYSPTEFAAVGGGFPLKLRGSGYIGYVAVSGLPPLEDHGFIVRSLRKFLAQHDS